MSFTFRPARRENTPLIIGLAGPTKSGKTYSALRLAVGLANGGTIAMINAEGLRGHQYAETFKYVACDIEAPFSPERYSEALKAAAQINPAVVIIDSASHCHDGPGGMLEYHEAELDRMTKSRPNERDKFNFTAWIRPKAAENQFIYTMLAMSCPVILCFRAKEKLKILPGKPPVDLGWQPIAGERVAFETIFTLMLPPHSKGKPDLAISEMREPFDTMVPGGQQIDEQLGQRLAAWAKGAAPRTVAHEADRRSGQAPATPSPAAAQDAPKEPPKAGDEPARGLFPPEGKAAAQMKPGSPKIPGVDIDDESQALAKLIEAAKAKLERQPNETQWKRLCTAIAGTEVLDLADPAALAELLELVNKLLAKDPAAIAKARAIIAPAEAKT